MSRGDDPPLAPFEELVHTNADLSHLVLDGLQSSVTTPTRPPRELKVVRVEARRSAGRLDPDPEDGLVRVEVLALGAHEVGGLGMHELKAELVLARWSLARKLQLWRSKHAVDKVQRGRGLGERQRHL